MGKPYQEKDTLYELYHRQGLHKTEIARKLGCSDVTVSNWMEKLGVPDVRASQRPEFVNSLYRSGLTQEQIADRLNCDQTRISTTLLDAGIETYEPNDRRHPSFYFSGDGYFTCRHRDGESRKSFRIHRLTAVAVFGFDALVDKDVHHKNHHKVDNRHSNLLPIDPGEHAKLHLHTGGSSKLTG